MCFYYCAIAWICVAQTIAGTHISILSFLLVVRAKFCWISDPLWIHELKEEALYLTNSRQKENDVFLFANDWYRYGHVIQSWTIIFQVMLVEFLGKTFLGLLTVHNTGMCTVDVAVGENHAAVSIVSPGAGYLESQTPRAPVERKDRRIWAFSNITGPLQQPGTSPDLLCEVNSLSGWCHCGCVSVAMIWSNLTVTRPEDKSKTKAQGSSVAGLLGFSEGVAERPG